MEFHMFILIILEIVALETFAKPQNNQLSKEKFELEIENVKQQVKELQIQLTKLSSSDLEARLEGGSKYCLTLECIAASNNLFQWMNKEADPCEDFNQFACGNFIKTSIIPDDKKRWTASDPLEDIGKKGMMVLSMLH